jgi:hypothetical protein
MEALYCSSIKIIIIFALGIKESRECGILGFYLTVKESHNNYKDVLVGKKNVLKLINKKMAFSRKIFI